MIKIIGAGFPRTGTTTLKWALETLGYADCYHMKVLLKNPWELKHWEILEKTNDTDWGKLFLNYQSSVDFPGYPYYKIIMEKYPNAKVILTVMPFENWYESVSSTIAKIGPQNIKEKLIALCRFPFDAKLRAIIKVSRFFEAVFWKKQFNGCFPNKIQAEKIYNQHIQEVISHVPPEKLLVYKVSQGWAPLCEFLDKPMPKEDFKHLNKDENFKHMIQQLTK
jgi:hypothetical protein